MCVNNLSKVAHDSAAAGIEPAISSRKSNALTTTPPSVALEWPLLVVGWRVVILTQFVYPPPIRTTRTVLQVGSGNSVEVDLQLQGLMSLTARWYSRIFLALN